MIKKSIYTVLALLLSLGSISAAPAGWNIPALTGAFTLTYTVVGEQNPYTLSIGLDPSWLSKASSVAAEGVDVPVLDAPFASYSSDTPAATLKVDYRALTDYTMQIPLKITEVAVGNTISYSGLLASLRGKNGYNTTFLQSVSLIKEVSGTPTLLKEFVAASDTYTFNGTDVADAASAKYYLEISAEFTTINTATGSAHEWSDDGTKAANWKGGRIPTGDNCKVVVAAGTRIDITSSTTIPKIAVLEVKGILNTAGTITESAN